MRDPVSTALPNMIILAHLFACGDLIFMRVTSPMASNQVPRLDLVFFLGIFVCSQSGYLSSIGTWRVVFFGGASFHNLAKKNSENEEKH